MREIPDSVKLYWLEDRIKELETTLRSIAECAYCCDAHTELASLQIGQPSAILRHAICGPCNKGRHKLCYGNPPAISVICDCRDQGHPGSGMETKGEQK
jgi:hypothetical protein